MSGSGASNLGYGDTYPNSNVNDDYVNVTGSNYAGNFSSNEIPTSIHSLPEPRSNIEAASGTWTGGRKNVSRVYRKMKAGRRKRTYRAKSSKRFSKSGKRGLRLKKSREMGGKRRTKSRKTRRSRKSRMSRRRRGSRKIKLRRMRGGTGYTQYQSNVPFTPGYAVAGVNVAPGMSATANPPPYEMYNHCQDNYNHYNATQGL